MDSGDRDGNPFVTPEITKQAVYMHAETALHEYIRRAKTIYTFDTFFWSHSTVRRIRCVIKK